MTEVVKGLKREELVDEGTATEEVVNDSLGTVDPADSTGVDSDKQIEADKASREMDKRHPAKP
jgi:hypothetical protein